MDRPVQYVEFFAELFIKIFCFGHRCVCSQSPTAKFSCLLSVESILFSIHWNLFRWVLVSTGIPLRPVARGRGSEPWDPRFALIPPHNAHTLFPPRESAWIFSKFYNRIILHGFDFQNIIPFVGEPDTIIFYGANFWLFGTRKHIYHGYVYPSLLTLHNFPSIPKHVVMKTNVCWELAARNEPMH